jgi:DNA-directed RNA polymerase specialized sigma24 family protein
MEDSVDWDLLRHSALAGALAGGAREEAEDVAQEALLCCFVSSGHLSAPSSFVFNKAHWVAIDMARLMKSRQRRESEWMAAGPRSARSWEGDIPMDLAQTLPAELLRIAHLMYAGLSFSEIAASMELSKPAVQRRVERLRRLLAA